MKKILIKNSVFGVIQVLINIVLVIITIPIIITKLGADIYGVFSLIMIFGSLNSLTNLGLNSALIKYLSEQGKCHQSNYDIMSTIIIVSLLIFPISFLLIHFDDFILKKIFGISGELINITTPFYKIVILSNILIIIGQIFKSILDSLQKIYITSIQNMVYNFFYWVLILVSVILGYGLYGIGISVLSASIIWFVITIISVFKMWGNIYSKGFFDNFWITSKKQINYGLKIYSGSLISFFYEPFTKLLISNFIGIKEVGFYDIAIRFKNQIWAIFHKLFYPLFPFFSNQNEILINQKYIQKLEQMIFLILIPLTATIFLMMDYIIFYWIGTSNLNLISITVKYIVCAHLLFSTAVIPAYLYFLAKDLVEKTIIIQFANMFFNFVIFLLLVDLFSYNVIFISNVSAIFFSFLITIYFQKKYIKISIFDSYLHISKYIFVFISCIILGELIKLLIIDKLLLIIILPVAILFFVLIAYRTLKLITIKDIQTFFGFDNNLSKILTKIFVK